jgi:hypothetical protein
METILTVSLALHPKPETPIPVVRTVSLVLPLFTAALLLFTAPIILASPTPSSLIPVVQVMLTCVLSVHACVHSWVPSACDSWCQVSKATVPRAYGGHTEHLTVLACRSRVGACEG